MIGYGGLLNALYFVTLQASRAYVAVLNFAIGNVVHFVNVYFESSSGSAQGVADVVAGSLTFTANTAYFRHYKHLRGNFSKFRGHMRKPA